MSFSRDNAMRDEPNGWDFWATKNPDGMNRIASEMADKNALKSFL